MRLAEEDEKWLQNFTCQNLDIRGNLEDLDADGERIVMLK